MIDIVLNGGAILAATLAGLVGLGLLGIANELASGKLIAHPSGLSHGQTI